MIKRLKITGSLGGGRLVKGAYRDASDEKTLEKFKPDK